ncbi:MAG TPA: hypothetical protein VJP85_09675 [Candidatus Baltobacteraceae bacterium]|nr:hypothetical protein [Candidatus Baltobacteraceae bacterium]
MRAPVDRIWQRIHQTAVKLAHQKSLPSARHAEAIVLQLVREENLDLPDDQTVTSLAEELRRATQFQPPQ